MDRRQFLAAGVALGTGAAGWRTGVDGVDAATDHTAYPFGMAGYDVSASVETQAEEGAPAGLDVQVAGDRVGPGESVTFGLSLSNDGDETLRYDHGPPGPFGLFYLRDGEADVSLIPWTDAYEDSDRVQTARSWGVVAVEDVALTSTVDAGATVTESYEASTSTHRIRPGTYERTMGYQVTGEDSGESWTIAASVTVEVEPADDPPGGDLERSLEAEAVNDDGFGGRLDVEVLAAPTEAHPGVIEVAFTAGWDAPREVRTHQGFPFGRFVSESAGGHRLALLTDRMYAPAFLSANGCWQSAFVPASDVPGGQVQRAFDPDETMRLRYVVTGVPSDDPQPGGTYTFESTFEVDGGAADGGESADLGVRLTLGERPDGYGSAMRERWPWLADDAGDDDEDGAADGGDATPTPTSTDVAGEDTDTDDGSDGSSGDGGDDDGGGDEGGGDDDGSPDASGSGGGNESGNANTPTPGEGAGMGPGAALAALGGGYLLELVRDRRG